MCMVSATIDYARTRIPVNDWTRPVYNDFQEILRRIEALDAKLGQPDCIDPAKAAWMREVEARLDALEAAKG